MEVERILELKDEIKVVSAAHGIQFTEEDFENFLAYLDSVRSLKDATEKFSGSGNISEVIPVIDKITCEINDSLASEFDKSENEFQQNLLQELKRVLDIDSLKQHSLFSVATFLDPRYKNLYFEQIQINSIKNHLQQLMEHKCLNSEYFFF